MNAINAINTINTINTLIPPKTIRIAPQLNLPSDPKMYRELYFKHINISGNFMIRNKLRGKRALWNGKFLLDYHMDPIYAPKEFLEELPPMPLDGILTDYSSDYRNPTNWDKVKYHVFDLPTKKIKYSDRVKILKKINNNRIEHFTFTEINNVEMNWKKINKLFSKNDQLILQNSDTVDYNKNTNTYEYSYGKTGTAKIVDFVTGTDLYRGILSKYKCISQKGNFFYLGKNIPENIRNKYKFSGQICTEIEKDAPKKGDTVYFETTKFVRNDVPTDPSYIVSM